MTTHPLSVARAYSPNAGLQKGYQTGKKRSNGAWGAAQSMSKEGGEMVLIKLLIGTGLYAGALAANIYWLVKHIASAGEEVRKRRENGGDYTRYGSYYGYYLRAVVLGTNIGALFCAIVHIIGEL